MATLKKFGMSYEGNCLEKPLKICHVFYTIFDFFFHFMLIPFGLIYTSYIISPTYQHPLKGKMKWKSNIGFSYTVVFKMLKRFCR